MKKFGILIILVLYGVFVLLASCSKVPTASENDLRREAVQTALNSTKKSSSDRVPNSTSASNVINFSKSNGTTRTTSQNALNVVKLFQPNISANSKLVYETPELQLVPYGLGQIKLTVLNPSQAINITVFFITEDDPNYNSKKSTKIYIDPGKTAPKSYMADLSVCYGFTGKLTRIKIESSAIYDGTLTLQKLEICTGGSNVYSFKIGEKITVATRDQLRNSTGNNKSFFPDGLMGIIKKSDGTINFFGSSPDISGLQSLTIYNGTYDNPTKNLISKDIAIQNTPSGKGTDQFQYSSIGQIYNFSGNECLSILHLEQHFDADGGRTNNQFYISALALAYSPDNGKSWYYAGIIGKQMCEGETGDELYGMGGHIPSTLNKGKPLSRDVGNGAFIIKDNFIYVYMIDIDKNFTTGFSVLRASVSDVIKAARAKALGRINIFKKYYNGGFNEAAIKGKFTNIVDDDCPANFSTIIYSTYLKKYLFIRCSSPMYTTNDGDIVMNISDDPLNFKGHNYYIDAGTRGQQYPTAVGVGSNPGFSTGKNLYIYYIDYAANDTFLWYKADLVRREIVFE